MIKCTTLGAVRVLSLDGPLVAEAADTLRDQVAANTGHGRPQVVIDLTGSPLIDSSGCEALLDVCDELTGVGGGVALAGVSPLCRDILDATRVTSRFELYEGAQEATASFAR